MLEDEDSEEEIALKDTDELEIDDSLSSAELAAINNDPVQLYLRKMGCISLLTRDEELQIAQSIEEGNYALLQIFARSILVLENLSQLKRKLKEGHVRAKNLIAGLDEDDNVIEDESKATRELIQNLDRAREDYDIVVGLRQQSQERELTEEAQALMNTHKQNYQNTIRSINFNSRQIDNMCSLMFKHKGKIDLTYRQLDRYRQNLVLDLEAADELFTEWERAHETENELSLIHI